MTEATLRIALTPGEPAGIGPDLCVDLAQRPLPVELVAVADPALLEQRARQLNLPLHIQVINHFTPAQQHVAGRLKVWPVKLAAPAEAGHLDAANAPYVLQCLRQAVQGCVDGHFAAMVTGPVHKGIINKAGLPFSGHTEYLAELTGAGQPVMMLQTPGLRVALATTHLPLRQVPGAINQPMLQRIVEILHEGLQTRMDVAKPRIFVCGLNPHAGEGGHLGREEEQIIEPVLHRLRSRGIDARGPFPADTLFTPDKLQQCDAVLAMYHDQGLPVLKHMGFGKAVNVTLGLPIVRTSVDHGTALDLAGSGKADAGSLEEALVLAIQMAVAQQRLQHKVQRHRG